MADIESLTKQNAELQAKIDALKKKLGIASGEASEAADERTKTQTIFREFDVNGDGVIDKNEFELLAFRCGTDLEQLVPEKLDAAFAALNVAGNGRITFDEFYNWLKAEKGPSKAGVVQLGLLRAKLQSKVWFKNFTDVKAGASSKPPSLETKSETKTVPSSSSSSSTSSSSSSSSTSVSSTGSEEKVPQTKFQISVGEFKDAGAGFYIKGGENSTLATQMRAAVNCPEDVPFFVYMDFALRDGYDEGEIGELVGQLDGLIGAIPFNQLPIQVYHSHTIDLVPDEKVLRVTMFSQLDPEQLARTLIAGGGGQAGLAALTGPAVTGATTTPGAGRLIDVIQGEFKIEVPFSLDDLQREDFRFTLDQFKLMIQAAGYIDKNLEARANEILSKLAPLQKFNMQSRLAGLKFTKGIDFTFKFSDLNALLAEVPSFDEDDNPEGLRPAAIQKMKAALTQAAEMPVSLVIQSAMQSLPIGAMLASAPPLQATYGQVRRNVLGLRRIHLQLHAAVTRFEFKGLDFVPLFPLDITPQE